MDRRGGAVMGVPARAGIGLRGPHVAEVTECRPAVGWLEVHTENYLGGGRILGALEALRDDYPVALHGVGLSLGTATGMSEHHLHRLKQLVERIEPAFVSEHLSWSVVDGAYLNHLLPLPYTDEALDVVCRHVDEVQTYLRRELLVENPSSYLRFRHSTMSEVEFLSALVRRTGCGVLCDVNNVYVTCENLGLDPRGYLAALPANAVGEIHLAGHSANRTDTGVILIDDHGSRVSEPVWALYDQAIQRFGAVPALVEWDTSLPPLAVLCAEALRADTIRSIIHEVAADDCAA